MSPAEILHRLGRRLITQAEFLGLTGATDAPPPDLSRAPAPWLSLPAGLEAAPYLAAADRLLAGKFDVFARHGIALGSPPRWNRDPKSGIQAPLSFGKLLDYRDPQRVGDIKYLWEPNRHLHLVRLAQAWALSGDTQYFEGIARQLENWFDCCPCGQGPNWSSSLEAGLRLINWSVTWQLLGGLASPLFEAAWAVRFRRRWLDSIYQHQRFINGFYSRHSSANNHLIGEASGQFVAALCWPHWPESADWQAGAQAILERQAQLQNAADGVNREQATAYQQWVIDLLLLPLLAARRQDLAFSPAYSTTLEKMLGFLAAIMDVGGHLPMFGDADDGVVVRLGLADSQEARYHSSLATGAVLFGRADFKAKAGALDAQSRWLLGPGADERYAALPAAPAGPTGQAVRQAFPEGGYYILGCDFETVDEIRLVADAGPLGYQRIAAHGHADALSFTLSLGGREFLIDPGTYAYHTEGAWRQYFRGTSAHNTLRVDGQDQSLSGGNFLWLEKAQSHCDVWQSSPDEDVLEAWHDGYRRLADPVIHRRRIVVDKAARRIVIEDRLEMRGEHDIELFFHCGEQCQVEHLAAGYVLTNDSRSLLLRLPRAANSSHRICRGELAPILGWVSRHFDQKEATTTLKWSARLSGKVRLVSELQC